MYLTYLVLLGLAIVCNCVLLIIFYINSQRNTTTISLFILLLLVNIWFIPLFLINALHAPENLFETLSKISSLGYIFVPVALLIFALSYSARDNILRRLDFWILILLPPLFFLFLSWTSNLVGVHTFSTIKLLPWGYESPTGRLWPHYILWFDLVVLVALGTLIRHYFTVEGLVRKKQTFYLILAIVIPLVFDTITIGILPVFNIFIFPIGLILLDIVTIVGISLIYRYGWFEVSPLIILSSINHVILTVDSKGRIIQINPFAEKIFKMKKFQLIGTPLDKILFIRHKDKINSNHSLQLLNLVLNRGKSMTFESFAVLINRRQELTDTISITPIFSENEIIGANIFLTDARKEIVREKQKDDFFSMLSHELKSPITSIKAYNQLLLSRYKDNNEENSIISKNIDKQLDRLTRLINDFFELTRLHNGKLTLKKEYFNLDEFAYKVIQTMKLTYKNRVFRLKGKSNTVVHADKYKIEQILINLINNAIKFSPEDKEIIIHVSSDPKKVTIGVQDYGRGIKTKFHKKVFNRFFQVGNFSKEKIGLGMGLFIASTIIKAHEGKIWVKSHFGKGSTFYFSLPVSK